MRYLIKTLIIVWMSLMLFSCKNNQVPEKGVALELAKERKAIIDSLEYNLFFSIPQALEDSVYGENILSFYLKKRPERLALDFKESPDKINTIKIGDHEIEYTFENEHIIISSQYLRKGENKINIRFTAGDLSLNRQEEFMYTLFVPDRARTAFPCFDQPDLKANFLLSLEIPANWTAVANGKEEKEIIKNDRKTIHFSKTRKLPTYLFSFAAGIFNTVERTENDRSVRIFHRENDDLGLKENIDEIYRQVFESLKWMENYTGIPYPFAKYDVVAIPSFQYGGMEHTGATLYRASRIFLPASPTEDQVLARANLIAHETAHMWFGDLVTMKWFDEVWLKEVFANFIAEKITNPWFPDMNYNLKFLVAHYPASYEIDRTEGANPIQQKLSNLEDAGTLYGAIIYHKAPIVMRKLEEITGDDVMRTGLQKYLEDHAYGNASWNDLISILDSQTETNLKTWSHIWVDEPGMPTYMFKAGERGYDFSQGDPQKRDRTWPDRFIVQSGSNTEEINITLAKNSGFVNIKDPAFINADGRGYGYFQLKDPVSYLDFFSEKYPTLEPLNRASQWLIIYENLLHDNLQPEKLLYKINELIPEENNSLVLSQILRIQKKIFWKFMRNEERIRSEPGITQILWEKYSDTEDRTRKTILNQLVELSLSDSNLNEIYSIWERKGGDSVSLSSRERMNISFELMLKIPGKYPVIAEKQESLLTNPDDIKEFEFVMPALDPDRAVRQKFFLDLEDPANRERESWVITAVSYLNHPLRQQDELNNLYHYLELVPEIKETGDIFFPKRWLDAVLWGHNSPEAKMIVDSFIEENPEFPQSLLTKLKQSADMLYRAVIIIK